MMTSLATFMDTIKDILIQIIGGGTGDSAVTFAESWVGTVLSTITSTPFFYVPVLASLGLFAIHWLRSLMGR